MRSIFRVGTGILLAAIVGVTSAGAQAGTIRGSVTDSSGGSIPNATVSVEGTGFRAATANDGTYHIRGVPPGTYQVRARAIGYQAAAVQVALTPGEDATQDFSLARGVTVLAPIDVVIGSRARHTAAEELAVPVDVFPAEQLQQQGSTETSVILQAVAPSINFPRQSVMDAGDIVRPFTLRGLSPDHTLVLLNGWRRHQTALVNNFNYGMGAGSSGVDLNALPASALDRIEVLRDGASAQYGSDAIAGVVNVVLKDGLFTPFVNADVGRYATGDYHDDGTTANVNGGWGIPLGGGSLGLFAEYRDRQPTNRAWADPFEDAGTGLTDVIDDKGQVVEKNNPVEQPNHHWGDGVEEDILTFANFRMPLNRCGHQRALRLRRLRTSRRDRQRLPPVRGQQPELARALSPGLPARPSAVRPTDWSAAGGLRGVVSGWNYDLGAEFGHNDFDYDMTTTNNASLGPCLETPCAPGPDRILGTADDPGIPNQTVLLLGKCLARGIHRGGQCSQTGQRRAAQPAQPRLWRGVPPGAIRHHRRRDCLLDQWVSPGSGQRRRRRRVRDARR